jgi:hypothetical protein
MPRRTQTGMLQINLTVSPQTYALLRRYAPNTRSYGKLVGDALTYYIRAQERDEMRERIEALEFTLSQLQDK